MFTKENTTIEYHSLVFSAHRHVSHAHRTLNLVAIWPVVTERADIFFFFIFPGGPRRYSICPAATRQKNLAKLFCVQGERRPDKTLQRVCTESKNNEKTQPFTCPDKLHKDFSSRERERDVENGGGMEGGLGEERSPHWNAHL